MYSKRYINIISFILALIVFLAINLLISQINQNTFANLKEDTNENIINLEAINEAINEEIQEDNKKQEIIQENTEEQIQNWRIEIPVISLVAEIAEGTNKETLDKYVGHFEITPKTDGNVGLAAHNRGYLVNYFAKLKVLKGGEEIIYTYGEYKKTYVVTQNIKISDIDWSYLENSAENKLTLITCIANEPAYRRCVQAIEKN